ncbi:MAG: AI-2E family transporter [Syntrophotaleaceae bacterium]
MLALIALLLYLAAVIAILFPFLQALLWAGIIALMTYPLYDRLYLAVNRRRNLASSLMTLGVILVLVLPVVALIVYFATQGQDFYENMEPALFNDPASIWHQIKKFPPVNLLINILNPIFARFEINLQETFRVALQQSMDVLVNFSTAVVKKSFSFALELVIMAVALFFIYRDGENFAQRILDLIPLRSEIKGLLIQRVKEVVTKILSGLLFACFIQGILATLGYLLVGLPVPVLLGIATAIAALIPLVGTTLVWVPAALILVLQGDYFRGLILLVWGAALISPSDNLIRALSMSGRAGTIYISPLVIILGLLGGMAVFGFIGIVLGPLVLSLFLSVMELFTSHPLQTSEDVDAQ